MADDFDIQLQKFSSAFRDALGTTIKKPLSAKLGYQDENGQIFLEVKKEDANQPLQYYFSSAAGQSFVGQAFLQSGILSPGELRYGAPIRVEQDVVNGAWKITGLDPLFAAEFFDGVDLEETTLIPLRRFEPGLLTSTIPYSMKAKVIEGVYDVGNEFKFIQTLDTINWGTVPHNSHVPAVGIARFVLVQLDVESETLSYKYGVEVPASMTFQQAYQYQKMAGVADILVGKDEGFFRCGYIKLMGGQTAIDRRDHIWSIQQVLGAASNDGDVAENVLSRIVCTDDEVVVADGEVVWID